MTVEDEHARDAARARADSAERERDTLKLEIGKLKASAAKHRGECDAWSKERAELRALLADATAAVERLEALTDASLDRLDALAAEIVTLKVGRPSVASLREYRRLLFYSARELVQLHGDVPLAERLEEEEAVAELNGLIGDTITPETIEPLPAPLCLCVFAVEGFKKHGQHDSRCEQYDCADDPATGCIVGMHGENCPRGAA